MSAILVRESDGRFSLALIDPFRTGRSVGTEPADRFGPIAAAAATALRKSDCNALIGVSYARSGLGVGNDEDVCARLESFPVANLVRRLPPAEPKPLGGNAEFAFYRLGEGQTRVVLVLAHQAPAEKLEGVPVPSGGAEYGLVDAYAILPPAS